MNVNENQIKNKVIVITGPTAVGKSGVAVELAKQLNAEIISADSSQVYKGFNIGSAKITQQEADGIKHHMIDILNFDQSFNVAMFKKLAEEKIAQIFSKNKNVIICGGTGLYIKALVYGYEFFNVQPNQKLRNQLEEIAKKQGIDKLFDLLLKLNPKKAQEIDRHNKVRLIRAIEIEKSTNKTKAVSKPKFSYDVFVLNADRKLLYEKINKRVDLMVESGLIEEVESLIKQGASPAHSSFKSIGYKEFYGYLTKGKPNLKQSIENLKQTTRKYAKRQITFFKGFKNTIWIEVQSKKQALQQIQSHIKFSKNNK